MSEVKDQTSKCDLQAGMPIESIGNHDASKIEEEIQEEMKTLRKMWQEAQDVETKRQLRSRMFKLREEKFRKYYGHDEDDDVEGIMSETYSMTTTTPSITISISEVLEDENDLDNDIKMRIQNTDRVQQLKEIQSQLQNQQIYEVDEPQDNNNTIMGFTSILEGDEDLESIHSNSNLNENSKNKSVFSNSFTTTSTSSTTIQDNDNSIDYKNDDNDGTIMSGISNSRASRNDIKDTKISKDLSNNKISSLAEKNIHSITNTRGSSNSSTRTVSGCGTNSSVSKGIEIERDNKLARNRNKVVEDGLSNITRTTTTTTTTTATTGMGDSEAEKEELKVKIGDICSEKVEKESCGNTTSIAATTTGSKNTIGDSRSSSRKFVGKNSAFESKSTIDTNDDEGILSATALGKSTQFTTTTIGTGSIDKREKSKSRESSPSKSKLPMRIGTGQKERMQDSELIDNKSTATNTKTTTKIAKTIVSGDIDGGERSTGKSKKSSTSTTTTLGVLEGGKEEESIIRELDILDTFLSQRSSSIEETQIQNQSQAVQVQGQSTATFTSTDTDTDNKTESFKIKETDHSTEKTRKNIEKDENEEGEILVEKANDTDMDIVGEVDVMVSGVEAPFSKKAYNYGHDDEEDHHHNRKETSHDEMNTNEVHYEGKKASESLSNIEAEIISTTNTTEDSTDCSASANAFSASASDSKKNIKSVKDRNYTSTTMDMGKKPEEQITTKIDKKGAQNQEIETSKTSEINASNPTTIESEVVVGKVNSYNVNTSFNGGGSSRRGSDGERGKSPSKISSDSSWIRKQEKYEADILSRPSVWAGKKDRNSSSSTTTAGTIGSTSTTKSISKDISGESNTNTTISSSNSKTSSRRSEKRVQEKLKSSSPEKELISKSQAAEKRDKITGERESKQQKHQNDEKLQSSEKVTGKNQTTTIGSSTGSNEIQSQVFSSKKEIFGKTTTPTINILAPSPLPNTTTTTTTPSSNKSTANSEQFTTTTTSITTSGIDDDDPLRPYTRAEIEKKNSGAVLQAKSLFETKACEASIDRSSADFGGNEGSSILTKVSKKREKFEARSRGERVSISSASSHQTLQEDERESQPIVQESSQKSSHTVTTGERNQSKSKHSGNSTSTTCSYNRSIMGTSSKKEKEANNHKTLERQVSGKRGSVVPLAGGIVREERNKSTTHKVDKKAETSRVEALLTRSKCMMTNERPSKPQVPFNTTTTSTTISTSSSGTTTRVIGSIPLETIESIEELESLLERATDYDERSSIRGRIRVIKRKALNTTGSTSNSNVRRREPVESTFGKFSSERRFSNSNNNNNTSSTINNNSSIQSSTTANSTKTTSYNSANVGHNGYDNITSSASRRRKCEFSSSKEDKESGSPRPLISLSQSPSPKSSMLVMSVENAMKKVRESKSKSPPPSSQGKPTTTVPLRELGIKISPSRTIKSMTIDVEMDGKEREKIGERKFSIEAKKLSKSESIERKKERKLNGNNSASNIANTNSTTGGITTTTTTTSTTHTGGGSRRKSSTNSEKDKENTHVETNQVTISRRKSNNNNTDSISTSTNNNSTTTTMPVSSKNEKSIKINEKRDSSRDLMRDTQSSSRRRGSINSNKSDEFQNNLRSSNTTKYTTTNTAKGSEVDCKFRKLSDGSKRVEEIIQKSGSRRKSSVESDKSASNSRKNSASTTTTTNNNITGKDTTSSSTNATVKITIEDKNIIDLKGKVGKKSQVRKASTTDDDNEDSKVNFKRIRNTTSSTGTGGDWSPPISTSKEDKFSSFGRKRLSSKELVLASNSGTESKIDADNKPENKKKKEEFTTNSGSTTTTTASVRRSQITCGNKSSKNATNNVIANKRASSPGKQLNTASNAVTSSYGVGPMDDNGLPLFGLKALKKIREIQKSGLVSTQPKSLDKSDDDGHTDMTTSTTTEVSEEKTLNLRNNNMYGLKALKVKQTVTSTSRTTTINSTDIHSSSTVGGGISGRKSNFTFEDQEPVDKIKIEEIFDDESPPQTPKALTSSYTSTTNRAHRDQKFSPSPSPTSMTKSILKKTSSFATPSVVSLESRTPDRENTPEKENTSRSSVERKTSGSTGSFSLTSVANIPRNYMGRSVKEISKKFDSPTSTGNQNQLPSFVRDNSKNSNFKIESTRTTTTSSGSYVSSNDDKEKSSTSFLKDREKVRGVGDVLERMRGDGAEDGGTEGDKAGLGLLNKFIGAQIIMSGVESMLSPSQIKLEKCELDSDRGRIESRLKSLSGSKVVSGESVTTMSSSQSSSTAVADLTAGELLMPFILGQLNNSLDNFGAFGGGSSDSNNSNINNPNPSNISSLSSSSIVGQAHGNNSNSRKCSLSNTNMNSNNTSTSNNITSEKILTTQTSMDKKEEPTVVVIDDQLGDGEVPPGGGGEPEECLFDSGTESGEDINRAGSPTEFTSFMEGLKNSLQTSTNFNNNRSNLFLRPSASCSSVNTNLNQSRPFSTFSQSSNQSKNRGFLSTNTSNKPSFSLSSSNLEMPSSGGTTNTTTETDLVQQVDRVLTQLKESLVQDPNCLSSNQDGGNNKGNAFIKDLDPSKGKELIALIDRLKSSLKNSGGNSVDKMTELFDGNCRRQSSGCVIPPYISFPSAEDPSSCDLFGGHKNSGGKGKLPWDMGNSRPPDIISALPLSVIQNQNSNVINQIKSNLFSNTSSTPLPPPESKTQKNSGKLFEKGVYSGNLQSTVKSYDEIIPSRTRISSTTNSTSAGGSTNRRKSPRSHTVGVSDEELAEARKFVQEQARQLTFLGYDGKSNPPQNDQSPPPGNEKKPQKSSSVQNQNQNRTFDQKNFRSPRPFMRAESLQEPWLSSNLNSSQSQLPSLPSNKPQSEVKVEAPPTSNASKLRSLRTLSLDNSFDPSKGLFTQEETIQIAIHQAAIKKQMSDEEDRRSSRRRGSLTSNNTQCKNQPRDFSLALPKPYSTPSKNPPEHVVASSSNNTGGKSRPESNRSVNFSPQSNISSPFTTSDDNQSINTIVNVNNNSNSNDLVISTSPDKSRGGDQLVLYQSSQSSPTTSSGVQQQQQNNGNNRIENVQISLKDLSNSSGEFPQLQIAITLNTNNGNSNSTCTSTNTINSGNGQGVCVSTSTSNLGGVNVNTSTLSSTQQLISAFQPQDDCKNNATSSTSRAFSRYKNKNERKKKMKRANTIDIPPQPGSGYTTTTDDGTEIDDSAELDDDDDDQNFIRGNLNIPFKPKTDGDRKFLAFLEKNNAFPDHKPAKPTYLLGGVNHDKFWNNRFYNIKTTFESSSQGSTPTASPIPSPLYGSGVLKSRSKSEIALQSGNKSVISRPPWVTQVIVPENNSSPNPGQPALLSSKGATPSSVKKKLEVFECKPTPVQEKQPSSTTHFRPLQNQNNLLNQYQKPYQNHQIQSQSNLLPFATTTESKRNSTILEKKLNFEKRQNEIAEEFKPPPPLMRRQGPQPPSKPSPLVTSSSTNQNQGHGENNTDLAAIRAEGVHMVHATTSALQAMKRSSFIPPPVSPVSSTANNYHDDPPPPPPTTPNSTINSHNLKQQSHSSTSFTVGAGDKTDKLWIRKDIDIDTISIPPPPSSTIDNKRVLQSKSRFEIPPPSISSNTINLNKMTKSSSEDSQILRQQQQQQQQQQQKQHSIAQRRSEFENFHRYGSTPILQQVKPEIPEKPSHLMGQTVRLAFPLQQQQIQQQNQSRPTNQQIQQQNINKPKLTAFGENRSFDEAVKKKLESVVSSVGFGIMPTTTTTPPNVKRVPVQILQHDGGSTNRRAAEMPAFKSSHLATHFTRASSSEPTSRRPSLTNIHALTMDHQQIQQQQQQQVDNNDNIYTPVVAKVMGGAQQQRVTVTRKEMSNLNNPESSEERCILTARSNIRSILNQYQQQQAAAAAAGNQENHATLSVQNQSQSQNHSPQLQRKNILPPLTKSHSGDFISLSQKKEISSVGTNTMRQQFTAASMPQIDDQNDQYKISKSITFETNDDKPHLPPLQVVKLREEKNNIPRQRSLSEFPRPFSYADPSSLDLNTNKTIKYLPSGAVEQQGHKKENSRSYPLDRIQRASSGSSIYDKAKNIFGTPTSTTSQEFSTSTTSINALQGQDSGSSGGGGRKKPPSLPRSNTLFTKQFEMQMSPDSADKKQREIESYFNQQQRAQRHHGKHHHMLSSQERSASISSKKSTDQNYPTDSGKIIRKSSSHSKILQRQSSLGSDDEDDVDEIFESLFRSSVVEQSKVAMSSTSKSEVVESVEVGHSAISATSSKIVQSQLQHESSSVQSGTMSSSMSSSKTSSSSSSSKTMQMSSSTSSTKGASPFAKFKQMDQTNSPAGGGKGLIKITPSSGGGGIVSAKEIILTWCQNRTRDYQHVKIENYSSSWSDGLAFCALIHHFFPDAFDYNSLDPKNRQENFDLAFKVADEKAGVYPLLDTEDMVMMGRRPDWKSVFTYVQSLYQKLKPLS